MNAIQKFLLTGRIPLWVKLAYTAFLAVLVPVYLKNYGPTNFLYFCDVALLMTLVAVWTESALWASAPLVGILVPQLLWMLDFFFEAAGQKLTGLTHYMFNTERPLFLRGLSFFHFWLPLLLIWMVWRLGHDRRAWAAWSVIGCTLLFVCYFFMPQPQTPPPDNPGLPVNINYVYGLKEEVEQDLLPPDVWFTGEVIILTFGVWLSTHLVLCKLIRPPTTAASAAAGAGG